MDNLPSPTKEPSDLNFILDKKRKLETSFKIPKKKRVDEPKPVEEAKPVPVSPVKEEPPKIKPVKVKKKKASVVVDLEKDEQPLIKEKPKLALLETPKMVLLDTPSTPEHPGEPLTPPMDEEEESDTQPHFILEVPKLEILHEYVTLEDGSKHPINRSIWLQVFSYLPHGNLAQCMSVCKVWQEWTSGPDLWKNVNLSRYGPIFPDTLKSIVMRQPLELDLSYCTISRKQADWLLPRLPGLKTVRLSGLSPNVIGSLYGALIPNLYHIDVSWVDDLNDWTLRDVICTTSGKESKPRFNDLRGLQLSGCPISEDAVKNIVQFCPNLEHLDMSYNSSMNDRVVDTVCSSSLIYSLKKIDFSGCAHVTDKSLLQLKKCYDLEWLDFRSCREVTRGACVRFTHSSKRELVITEDKLIHPASSAVY